MAMPSQKVDQNLPITIVTGFPRSGTSMMMQVLLAGGMAVVSDGTRMADAQNPRGYLEWEPIKTLRNPTHSIQFEAFRGMALKVIYRLVYHLPRLSPGFNLIVMHRNFQEVFHSQQRLLQHLGKPTQGTYQTWLPLFRKEWEVFQKWIENQAQFRIFHADYNRLLFQPEPTVKRLQGFLGGKLNLHAMLETIDPKLYRQRNLAGS
jgi:hypothetical protein